MPEATEKKRKRARPQQVEPVPAAATDRRRLVLYALVVVGCLLFSCVARWRQYEAWKEEPERHFVHGRPLLTSLDGYYWARLAEDYENGAYHRDDPLRGYPEGWNRPRLVLLSLVLAGSAALLGTNPYTVSIYLIPFLASLFLIPLAAYCWKIELPAAGILGGLVGSFAHEYYMRTSIAAVDADALNLCFPLLASVLILNVHGSRTRVLVFSTLAGLSMLLYVQWYFHTGFSLVYLVVLVVWLLFQRIPRRTALGAVGLFVLACNPIYVGSGLRGFSSFVNNYILRSESLVKATTLLLPNALETTTSGERVTVMEGLDRVLEPAWVVALGLVLFAIAAWAHRKRIVPLLPIVGLAVLTFTSGRRFAMFLAPLTGFGLGYLVTLLFKRVLPGGHPRQPYRDLVLYGAALLVFLAVYPGTAGGRLPNSVPSTAVARTIDRLREELPEHSPVLTWWDYGYPLNALGGFATYHDGSRRGFKTILIARALSSTSERELYDTVALLEQVDPATILKRLEGSRSPASELHRILGTAGNVGREDVYLLLLNAMVTKYAAIHYLGTWDLDSGSGSPDGYQTLNCTEWRNHKLRCEGLTIDTSTGWARNDLQLERLVLIRNGRVAQEISFPNRTGVTMQVLLDDTGAFGFYLLDERVYRSNFNQLFFLDAADGAFLEKVYDDFPTARVYRFTGVRP